MRCVVPGRALYSAKFALYSGAYSSSAWRMPNENAVALSLRYQL